MPNSLNEGPGIEPGVDVVCRYDQDPARSRELSTPFRPFSIESLTRADGTVLLGWPSEVCALQPCKASAHAAMNGRVGNVTDWLDVWAAERPDTLFIAERNSQGAWEGVTYREASRRIHAIGDGLLSRCATLDARQPVIAILSPNSLRQALLTLAALYVGIAVAPISPAYSSAAGDPVRLRLVFDTLTPQFAYSEQPNTSAAALDALDVPTSARLSAADIDAWTNAAGASTANAAAIAHREAVGERVAKVMFTSGSTGTPKAVAMTHQMLASAQATTAAILEHLPVRPQVYLEWLPWHHVMGGNISMHRTLRFGATMYLDGGKPVASKFRETLANLREIAPTFYFNVPLGYAMLIPELEREAELARHFFSRLEYLSFGGAALSRELIERIDRLALTHAGRRIPVTSGYGATESCGPALTTPWNTDSAGVLGLPAPGVRAKLVRVDDRYELRLAGGNIATSYLHDPQASASAIDDEGYYRTGDAVRWADAHDPMKGLAFAGRVSEDFKLASGTWVNAGALRLQLVDALAPLVTDAVITGHDRGFIGAMAFIDERACREFCEAGPLAPADLVVHPGLLQEIARRLKRFNGTAQASSLRVCRALLLAEPPVADAFEITEKGYLNQRAVLQRRAALVDALYANTPVACVVQADD
jgi:feruloyl-CoA synthase